MIKTTATIHESDTASAQRHTARTATGEGEAYWFFGGLVVIRSPEGSRLIVIETTMPPGGGAPLHVHTNLDDNIYLLSGRLAVRSGDQTIVLRAGDYVSEPAGVPQTLAVLDNEPAVLLQIHANEDFLRFIRQAGTPATGRAARLRGAVQDRGGDRTASDRPPDDCR
jgi:quercetin dioxygenase-like cupin family protein